MKRAFGLAATLFLLNGCSGGTGSSPNLQPRSSTLTASALVQMTVTIGGDRAAALTRAPQYVSHSTNGVLVNVYASADTSHTTLLGSSATDVSSGSAACGGATGFPRTCSVYIPAPFGTDDFVFTAYDAAPIANSFSTANALATGSVTNKTITQNAANTLTASLGGQIKTITLGPASQSSPADGTGSSGSPFTLTITAKDSGANTITAGASDPYTNPVTLSVTDSGAHTKLILNGAAAASSVLVTKSSDAVTVTYDGLGSPGYSASIAASATGATGATTTVNPLYVTSASAYFAAANPASTVSFGQPGLNATITVSEAGFAGTFTATPTGCSGKVSIGAFSGTGASQTVTLTSGSTAGTCTIALSDGISTVNLNVSNSSTSSTIVIP